ncbi:hypothetical protein GGQ87_001495 [Brevundimonas alba]|uniref:Uncharacterized protein n=1 Tax=Brevundimonas alba TaxID=74314 RepID=A0A7X5YKC3_9CAUL|nr:hypothetical protein [Brevundimonas alba]NJC41237.1 hypothetical protein [Brevundimonas alba]
MSYGPDFATADAANAPLDAPLLIGADPMIWGAILLALVVAAMIGWLMGSGSRSRKGDAAPGIWEAVDDAAKNAMKADTDSLPARAAELQRVVKARLGCTLAFGGDLNRCMKSLDEALKGEVDEKAHAGGHSPAPHGETPHDHDGQGQDHAPAPAQANVTISVHAPTTGAGHAPHQPHHSPKRPMTTQERNDALRLAVAAFNDYWRHRSARQGEMRAIVAELSDPGPRRPHLSHSGGHH